MTGNKGFHHYDSIRLGHLDFQPPTRNSEDPFDAYVRAFGGELVGVPPPGATKDRFSGKTILFADVKVTINDAIA